ncbi:hypothetical protein DTO96_102389 [Ephemeroptericola cinctiostellae]|uniref:Baseplate J-like central domain-containing protein n=1 Tax=Ephemeroptericola cinctiostellae TaxID=2268024 RepID=A0A345DE46_9BURK|nr:baseplate J/gp47 family protein [Ephemeroptericola cinctiostellae]AXF86634.1 hypothetical protein DTO96_102389 [Ephemeroptericola cinctiostellae]
MTYTLTTSTASTLAAVDLSKLAMPDLLKVGSYEDVLAEMIAGVNAFFIKKTGETYIVHEADPVYVAVEAMAYRRWLDLQNYASQTRQNLLAYAVGAMLDHIGAHPRVQTARLVIVPADLRTAPVTPAVMESDDDYRLRLTLRVEGYTTAGSAGSYLYHALSVSGNIRDASVYSPSRTGDVRLTVLTRDNNGVASPSLCAAVEAYLSIDTLRPIGDVVSCSPATVVEYQVAVDLTIYKGGDKIAVRAAALAALAAYTEAHFKLEHDITVSGLIAAAHVYGVQKTDLIFTDIECGVTQAARCTGIAVSIVGEDL